MTENGTRSPRHGGQTPKEHVGTRQSGENLELHPGLKLVGLAMRARRACAGSDVVLEQIRKGTAALVFLAADAGGNARKKYRDKCAFYHIRLVEQFDRAQLSNACGRSAVVIAVTDPGFAATIVSRIGESLGGEAFDETSGI